MDAALLTGKIMLNVFLEAWMLAFVAVSTVYYVGFVSGAEKKYDAFIPIHQNIEGFDMCIDHSMEQLSGGCLNEYFTEAQLNTTGIFSECFYESLQKTASLGGNSTAGSSNSFTVEENHSVIEGTSAAMLLGHSAVLLWIGLACSLTPLQLFASISPNLIGFSIIAAVLRAYPETYVDGLVMAVILSLIAAFATFVLAYMVQKYYFENEDGARGFWIAVKYAKKRQAEGPFETKEKVTWQTRCKRSLMIAIPQFFVVFIIIFYSIAIFGLFKYRSGSAWYTFVAILAQVVKVGGNKLQILLLKGDTGWFSENNMYMVSFFMLQKLSMIWYCFFFNL